MFDFCSLGDGISDMEAVYQAAYTCTVSQYFGSIVLSSTPVTYYKEFGTPFHFCNLVLMNKTVQHFR